MFSVWVAVRSEKREGGKGRRNYKGTCVNYTFTETERRERLIIILGTQKVDTKFTNSE